MRCEVDGYFGARLAKGPRVVANEHRVVGEGVRNSVFGRSGGLSHSARDVAAWQ